MVEIPDQTRDAIYKLYAKREAEQPARDYLGGSQIGDQCVRKLWYVLRQVKRVQHDGRICRLFDSGHREEARVIEDLRAIGCEVWDKDPATGQQWRYSEGLFSIGLDGVVLGIPEAPKTPHVLEVKTANTKNYAAIVAKGCMAAKPAHYAQCQLGMHFADLDRALYVVVCKDTDEIYTERLEYDANTAKALLLKAKRVIASPSPLERISEDPSFYLCRFCDYAGICHGEEIPAAHCRTCIMWGAPDHCSNGLEIAPDCTEHLYQPGLLSPWAGEPLAIGEGHVDYKTFANVAGLCAFPPNGPVYASAELANCTPAAVGQPQVEAARRVLGGKVIASKKLC